MMIRRLLIDALIVVANVLIVVAAISLVLLVNRLAEPTPQPSLFGLYCTRFLVEQTPSVSGSSHTDPGAPWTASITISNAGPYAAVLLSGVVISKFRTGSERWGVSMPGAVVQPRKAISIRQQLPASPGAGGAPRVWEFSGSYKTRPRKLYQWLGALQDRLPPAWQRFNLPKPWFHKFDGRYPENYESVLTKDLGWRFKAVSWGGQAPWVDWGPPVASPQQREFMRQLATFYAGKPVIVTAAAPLGGVDTNKAPGMIILKDLLVRYYGQVERTTELGVRMRAITANEAGNFDTVEVRAEDVLAIEPIRSKPN
jgi:hypothetical protein